MTNDVIMTLTEGFDDAVHEISHGQDVVRLPGELWLEFAVAARDAGFEACMDVTVVDWLRSREDRYEVIAILVSMKHRLRLRMITTVPRQEPKVASLVPLYPGVSFGEREAYDMFGIIFDGHPDLTRILMPDDWEGHPLRKDFSVGSVPVQFKKSHQVN